MKYISNGMQILAPVYICVTTQGETFIVGAWGENQYVSLGAFDNLADAKSLISKLSDYLGAYEVS